MRDDGRRARIIAAVTEHDTAAGVGELVQRLCRFVVDEMGLSGCALVLMSGAESASVLAGAGRHARTVTDHTASNPNGPSRVGHAAGGWQSCFCRYRSTRQVWTLRDRLAGRDGEYK